MQKNKEKDTHSRVFSFSGTDTQNGTGLKTEDFLYFLSKY